MRGHGEPLPPEERAFFEKRFGYDLSRVRVHSHPAAADAALALQADAFTWRNDIAFAEGRYQLDSAVGRRLLAHELVHVIQQGEALPLHAGATAVTKVGDGAPIARQAMNGGDPEESRAREPLVIEGDVPSPAHPPPACR